MHNKRSINLSKEEWILYKKQNLHWISRRIAELSLFWVLNVTSFNPCLRTVKVLPKLSRCRLLCFCLLTLCFAIPCQFFADYVRVWTAVLISVERELVYPQTCYSHIHKFNAKPLKCFLESWEDSSGEKYFSHFTYWVWKSSYPTSKWPIPLNRTAVILINAAVNV